MRTAYEIVKAHYEASDRGDIEAMMADVAEDCHWTEMDGFPCRGTYTGPVEVVENVFMALGKAFEGYTMKLERLLDAGDSIVGIGVYSGTHRETGKHFVARVVHVWDVEGGKIRRFEQFTDTLRVAEAMR